MNATFIQTRKSQGQRLPLGFMLILIGALVAAGLTRSGKASSPPSQTSSGDKQGAQKFKTAAADTCAAATDINAASLPFEQESTLSGAANDIDPPPPSCAPGGGNDVVYSFTPSATDIYTIGVTPTTSADLSLYILTDCSNPAGSCVAGTNANGFDRGEVLTHTLTAGTRYFIVVDTPTPDTNAGGFHFSLRRGLAANDTCGTATVIDPSRLPVSVSGSTFGATNNLDPGASCSLSSLSTQGPDVVFQFTPADTQQYVITVTPSGRYDTSVYVITDCSSNAGCFGSDARGSGTPETLHVNLSAGVTYFIAVDGFLGDAGDFTFSIQPSILRGPLAPSDLTATATAGTQINLAWHDNSTDELGFRAERSLDGFNFNEIAAVGANTTTFADTNVLPNTLYFYRVSAFNNLGNSDVSNIAFAQTPENPIPVNPVIVVTPTSIDFGSVRVTQSDTKTVTITNGGAAPLIISAIGDPGGPFTIIDKPALPLTLQSTESVTLNIRFAPISPGRSDALFGILSNDPNALLTTVSLTAVGAAAPVPNLEVSPVSVDFGTTTTPKTLDLKNTGEADLLIATILPPNAPFSLSGSGTGTLKTGEKKTLTVTFSPPTLGVFQSGVSIVSNDPDSLITFVPVRGTALVAGPTVVGLQFKKKGLRFQSAGSNVVTGAVLIVDNKETFSLTLGDGLWLVVKSTRSTPGNLRIIDMFTPGSTHSVVVKNPNGGTSAPVTISG